MDGGWWPRSRDLLAETIVLVNQFPRWFDRIWRVVYSAPDWDCVAQQRIHVSGLWVTLSSFPDDDTHLALLKSVSSAQILQVLVIPAGWNAARAEAAMSAACSPSNTRSATAILDRYRDQSQSL